MYLPLLQPVVNSDSYINGDVTLHPLTAIAPGVILQTSPDGKIVVEDNVCLGMGVIIHAYGGTVTIRKGAILGAGVLIIGSATIGSNSCIGASSTLIDTDVEAHGAIAPGTLLGDTSRQVNLEEEPSQRQVNQEEPLPSPWDTPEEEPETQVVTPESVPELELEGEFVNETPLNSDQEIQELEAQEEQEIETPKTPERQENPSPSTVVGKMYVNQLLVTLFPQNQNLKKPKLND